MRMLPLAAAVAALLVPAAPALAGDPTMPLSQVQAGMRCTGYSVIQGTAISAFDVQVLDVAAGEASGVGDILVEVSGPAVDATGIGPGFSGSPIYCPDAAGVSAQHRRDLAVDERVRRQGRAGDADRGDHRHAGRRRRARRVDGPARRARRTRRRQAPRRARGGATADAARAARALAAARPHGLAAERAMQRR